MSGNASPLTVSLFQSVSMYDPRKDPVVQDLIDVSLKVARDRIEDLKESHHPSMGEEIERVEMEKHEERVDAIKLHFFQKATGHPF